MALLVLVGAVSSIARADEVDDLLALTAGTDRMTCDVGESIAKFPLRERWMECRAMTSRHHEGQKQ